MLQPVAQDIWHQQHALSVMGIRATSRMTVVRLTDGRLWLHSPVPISSDVQAQLAALGQVAFIIAPNRFHHLYVGPCAAAYPSATVYGAPGLDEKRRDLVMRPLRNVPEPEWAPDLGQVFVEGVPTLNETVWYHEKSRTLIITDLCHYMKGDLPLSSRLYAGLMGVRRRPAVSNGVRLVIRDRAALARSVQKILQWDFERVVFAHNVILERNAYDALKRAFDEVL
jgi:hypothetical protein